MNKYQFHQLEKRNTQYHYRKKINLDQSSNFSFPKFRVGKIFSQIWKNFEEIRIGTETEFRP